MNCNEVKERLPEYIADQCSNSEKVEISRHLSGCSHCMKIFEELEAPFLKGNKNDNNTDTKRLLKKARRALLLKVVTTTILSVIIFISAFFVVIPGILKAVRYPKINDITRSLGDIVQFTSPSQVGGYGNSGTAFGEYSFEVSTFTYDITGTKKKNSAEVTRKFNLITGKFQSPAPHVAQYVHPEVEVSEDFLSQFKPNAAKNILTRNGDTTVATVDISLNSILSLEEVAVSLRDLDVRVLWMAVECGSESTRPKNMTAGINQFIQWGIPGVLFNPFDTHGYEFNYSNLSEYEKAIMEELKWLDENKHYISANKSLLKYNDLDTSVGNKVKYIIDNGFKVYGLRITGPSSELSKLDSKLAVRIEEVIDIEFYYWN